MTEDNAPTMQAGEKAPNEQPPRKPIKSLFPLLMLLSGFAGISYEILYGRMLGNLLGDQFAVSASILVTFLLGIGIGAVSAYRLWRYLWVIEAAIGVCGALFAANLELVDRWLYQSPSWLAGGLEAALFGCFLLLLLPAFLIGCSLPLFAGYLSRLQDGPVFSRAYGIYNIGAAITALLIEYLLIRWLGIRGAVYLIVAINGIVALALVSGFTTIARNPPTREQQPLRFDRSDLVALVLASIASAIFQLFMIKLAEMLLGPFRETFALVLSLVLLGIALGAMLIHRFPLRLGQVILLALVGLCLLMGLLEPAVYVYAEHYSDQATSHLTAAVLKWLLLAFLMGLPSIFFGATLPALLSRQSQVARESGQLLLVSALANTLGFLLMVFLLHRYLDYGVQLLVMVGLVALAAVLADRLRSKTLVTTLLLAGIAVGLHQTRWNEDLLFYSYTNFRSLEDLEEAGHELESFDRYRGHQDVFSINWRNGKPYFFINGYTSISLDNPSEKIVGAVASMFAPRNDRALVLGLGSGATASAVGQLFDQTEVVEINPVVRENLHRMAKWNYGIEQNPKVNIVVDDAIHYTKGSNQHYSLILNTVTTPLYFSSSKLYTREFFKVIRQRLTDDGLYVTWMDSRIGDRGVEITLTTLADSFAHCGLLYIKSTYYLLACSPHPIKARKPLLAKQHPLITKDLYEQHQVESAWLAYSLMTPDALSLIVPSASAPLNSIDYPALEFEMARLTNKGIPVFKQRLLDHLDPQRLEEPLTTLEQFDPITLAVQAELMLGKSSIAKRWKKLALAGDKAADIRFEDRLHRHFALMKKNPATAAIAYHKEGYWLLKQKRCPEAIIEFNKALALDPNHDNSHYNIGSCYERLKRYDLARDFYLKARAMDSDDEAVPYRLARVDFKDKRYRSAFAYTEEALGMKVNAKALYLKGRILEKLGRKVDAIDAYKRAIKANPKRARAARALKRLGY